MDAPVAGFPTETLLLLPVGPPLIQKRTETETTRTLDSLTFTFSLPRSSTGTTSFHTQSPDDTTTTAMEQKEDGGGGHPEEPRKYVKVVFNKTSKNRT